MVWEKPLLPIPGNNRTDFQINLMSRDTLYKSLEPAGRFEFNQRVAEVFDDMLDRSVPFYRQVIEMSAEILDGKLKPGDVVYDLGCSTGTTLLYLARMLEAKNLRFVGLDNSRAMLDKAFRKAEMFSLANRINFIEQDITRAELSDAGGILLNYTLQFINPSVRLDFLKNIYKGLRKDGVLILSEKVVSKDEAFNEQFQQSYYQFKKRRGYSELEIAKKREALENVLIPFSLEENRNLLLEAGFTKVTSFFQWFNFVSFVASK